MIAFFSDWLFREEEELCLAIDVDQQILAFLDEWVRRDFSDELQQGFLGELATCCEPSPSLDEELLLCWVVDLTLYVRLLIVGSEMSVCDYDEVPFGVRYPFCF